MDKKIIKIAEKTQEYITKNKNVPASVKVDNVKYNYGKLISIFADAIVNNKAKVTNKTINNAPAPTGDKINTDIKKENYITICKTTNSFINKESRAPNYALFKNTKIHPLILVDAFSRIILFSNKNNRLPNTCKFNSGIIKKNTASPIQSNDSVFKYFVKVFGAVKTIDEALGKVKDRGYGHYFDDFLSNIQTIDNLKNGGQKPNCTDACHVFWHIAKALGYDVIVEHVRCKSSGEGHVRLKLRHAKHTGGNWIRRDPACVVSANGKALTEIWCSNGTLLATNPSWFMVNVNR